MENQKWVAVWGVSPSISEPHAARYAKDITLRYTITTPLQGKAFRARLSNLGSTVDAEVTEMFIRCIHADGTVGTAQRVTFGGKTSGLIPAGGFLKTDEIPFVTGRGDQIAVSLYFLNVTHMASGTNSTGPYCRGMFAEGNFAADVELPEYYRADTSTFFFLDTVDVLANEQDHAIVCFGDSITAQSWPDWLLDRLLKEDIEHVSVVRRGIGGSRILRKYSHVAKRHYGDFGMERYQRETVCAGADTIIVLHGVNDIIHPDGSTYRPWSDLPSAEQIINGIREYIRAGHLQGCKVYVSTITTIKGWSTWIPERDDIRHAVNEWIRTQQEADGYIDFDLAIRAKDDIDLREPEYDSGDHLHPSLAGAKAMADSIPLEFLK